MPKGRHAESGALLDESVTMYFLPVENQHCAVLPRLLR